MVQKEGLVIGGFYWVIQAPGALDQRAEWQSAPQPARLAGITAQGELLWNYIAVGGLSDWPVTWISDICTKPVQCADTVDASDAVKELVSRLLSGYRAK